MDVDEVKMDEMDVVEGLDHIVYLYLIQEIPLEISKKLLYNFNK